MKIVIRQGVFETNSSSEHAINICFGNWSVERYIDDETYEVELNDTNIGDLISVLPVTLLESELRRRKSILTSISTEDLEFELNRRRNNK